MAEVKKQDMLNVDLFSVVVLHYSQQQYINEALDSVFVQDYDNIELIIADDGTPGLDTSRIQAYVEAHRTDRIAKVVYLFSQENLGTVRNVNQALRAASGRYALFFAADDALYDSKVLTNFAKTLSGLPTDHYMVTAQCAMMDDAMEEKLGDFVNVPLSYNMNKGTAMDQYHKLVFSCCFAMGATAFKMEMLNDKGYFDETYKIIEDWSYYLSLTYGGSKITYVDFNALKHRDGGVSHFNQEVLPSHVIEYKNDSLLIQERLVLPHLSNFPLPEQVKLMNRYDWERKCFAQLSTGKPRPSKISLMARHKGFYAHKLVWWLIDNDAHFRKACLSAAKILLIVWAALRVIEIVAVALLPEQQWILLHTPAYYIVTLIVFILFIASVAAWLFLIIIRRLLAIRMWLKNLFSKKQ